MTGKGGPAVIFDLDGTLLNSLEDLAGSMNAALRDLGFPGHSVERYRYMVGDGITALVQRALPSGSDGKLIELGVAKMKAEYAKRWHQKTRPYPGVAEMLDVLVERSIPLNILSNKMADFTSRMVDWFLSAWSFRSVVGLDDKVPKKPDPRGALQIASKIGIPPERFIFLGDTKTDMQTACAAGMVPVGVDWGFRTREELLANGAIEVINSPQDFIDLLPAANKKP